MKLIRIRGAAWMAALAVVGLVVGITTGATSTDDLEEVEVTAIFRDASPLVAGNVVKAAGVTVGEIRSIDLVQGHAHVRMTVDKGVLPLHTDARAVPTEQDLLGERYVALVKGNPAAPTMDDGELVIPETQTDRSVDLQSIFNGVDTPTGTALAALVTTLGEGVNGRGPEIAAGIKAFEPAMRRADELSRMLSEQNVLLTGLMDSARPVLNAVSADQGRKMDSFVGSAEKTLSVVAENREATKAALDRLPATLASAQNTLARVAGVAERGTPTLAGMRPVTDDLTAISDELRDFSEAADPALASLNPVLDRGKEMLDQAAPVAEALRSAGPDIRGTAQGGRQIMDKALSGRLVNLMEFVKGWSLSTADYDGLSHYFRAYVSVTPKALGHSGVGPAPASPYAPVPSLEYPNLGVPTPLGSAPDQQARDANRGHVAPPDQSQSSPGTTDKRRQGATGMTKDQENAMLGQLLGGR